MYVIMGDSDSNQISINSEDQVLVVGCALGQSLLYVIALFIKLAHIVLEPSVLVAASVICLSVCPTSGLGNYARYA